MGTHFHGQNKLETDSSLTWVSAVLLPMLNGWKCKLSPVFVVHQVCSFSLMNPLAIACCAGRNCRRSRRQAYRLDQNQMRDQKIDSSQQNILVDQVSRWVSPLHRHNCQGCYPKTQNLSNMHQQLGWFGRLECIPANANVTVNLHNNLHAPTLCVWAGDPELPQVLDFLISDVEMESSDGKLPRSEFLENIWPAATCGTYTTLLSDLMSYIVVLILV